MILLFSLYLSQGLPFGFQVTALPLIMREEGVSLAVIGTSTLLAAPWILKIIWAPLVDSKWHHVTGRRRSWIIPLQIFFIISIWSASLSSGESIMMLAINMLIMNFIASIQDVAVDGLAVDILKKGDLGYGNAVQVIGYKSGMIISGGFLVWLGGIAGWGIVFSVMALIAVIPLVLILVFKEEPLTSTGSGSKPDIMSVLRLMFVYINIKSFRSLLLFTATYKLGESMIDAMYKPFLYDSGMTPSKIGIIAGTYGMLASIAGSITGGIFSSRAGCYRALFISSVTRLFPLIYISTLALNGMSDADIIAATLLEHFFGGMLTTTMFAYMMFNVDKNIGATHYTLLAVIEVIGKMPGGFMSGFITGYSGYAGTFIIGSLLSAAVIFILPYCKIALQTGERR